MDSFAVILPAAGRSVRYGGGRNKLLEQLGTFPVLRHTIGVFLARNDVVSVVIAGDREMIHDTLRPDGGALDYRLRICPGGASRAHSVYNALCEVPAAVEWVAVHDAARPLVSQGLIDRTIAAARQYGAAVPALPVSLTIKQADGPLPAQVRGTLPRRTLWAMQTPQIMPRRALLDAYANCPLPLEEVTDDVQLIELAGRAVWLVEGEERNLKITTGIDLKIAEWWLGLP